MMLKSDAKTALYFLFGIAVCLGLTALVYWPGLSGPFMLDDNPNIGVSYVPNPDWDAILYILTHNESGLFGRSVSMLSFILTSMQYALDPWGYKYHNLLLHLLSGLVLLRLLQLLLPLLDRRLDERKTLLISGVTVSLWLLHPFLVSTVLYAVQRMTQLSALFTLLALLAWVKARGAPQPWRFYLYAWVVFPLMTVFAVLAKENGALIPLYVLAIEVLAYRTSLAELRRNRRVALATAVFVALPIVLALLVLVVRWDIMTEYSGRTFTLGERLLTQIHVLFFYVQMILMPRIRSMSLFHDDFPVTTSLGPSTIALLVVLVGLIILAWRMRHLWPVAAFGLAWFLASHLMESTIFPLELVFEHRNYLASVGLLLVPVHLVFVAERARPLRLLSPLFVAMFAFMTATRAAEWGDAGVFYQIAVQEHPGSGRALNSYANYLTNKGDYDGTVAQLEKLSELTPDELGVPLHLQALKCAADLRDDDALAHARELASRLPISVYGYNALQNLLMFVIDGKCSVVKPEDLEPIVNAAVAFAEQRATSVRLAVLLRLRGILAFQKGYYASGYSDYRTAHEMTGDITVLHELMRYQLQRGLIGDAEETMALMEQQNARRLGLDEHQLKSTRGMLERVKRERDAALARGAKEAAEEQARTAEAAPATVR